MEIKQLQIFLMSTILHFTFSKITTYFFELIYFMQEVTRRSFLSMPIILYTLPGRMAQLLSRLLLSRSPTTDVKRCFWGIFRTIYIPLAKEGKKKPS